MNEVYLTFRSLTQAQMGLRLLRQMGIPARLARAPKQIAERGCSNTILLEERELSGARAALKTVPIRKIFRRNQAGHLEEVLT